MFQNLKFKKCVELNLLASQSKLLKFRESKKGLLDFKINKSFNNMIGPNIRDYKVLLINKIGLLSNPPKGMPRLLAVVLAAGLFGDF